MKFHYGEQSQKELATIDPLLHMVFEEALKIGLIDIHIVQGRRGKKEQEKYFKAKKSRKHWPNSKHNTTSDIMLARAVDAVPYINGTASWKKEHCIFLAGIVLTIAKQFDVKIRWGGNWDMDAEPITDQDFQDLAHYERV